MSSWDGKEEMQINIRVLNDVDDDDDCVAWILIWLEEMGILHVGNIQTDWLGG